MLIERNAVKTVARLVPWLAPVPSAWLVGRAVMGHLSFPLPMAIVTGLVIEGLGLVSAYNWQWFSDWNRKKLKSDPAAPAILPAVMGAFYLLVAIGLVVILEVLPELATFAPATLPLLALVGTVNMALISGQELREAEAETAKAERKQARKERKAEKAETATRKRKRQPATEAATENRKHAAAILAEEPDISGADLGRQLGLSDRQGRNLRAELLPEISGNGRDK